MGISVKETIAFHIRYMEDHTMCADPPVRQPEKEEIVSAVFQRFHPSRVRAISLFGSRADGRSEETSDVDVVVLLDAAEREQIICYENGLYYNLLGLPRRIFFSEELNAEVRWFYGMEPLYDPFGEGKRIKEMTDQFVVTQNRSLPRPDNACRETVLAYLKSSEGNDTPAALSRNWLLFKSPALLAAYNGYLCVGEKKILDILLRDSPEAAGKFALALLPGSDQEYLRDWVTAAFSGPIQADFECLDFSASVRSFEKRFLAQDGKEYSLKELYSRKKYYYHYLTEFCKHFHISDLNHEKLLSELQKKAPPVYEYLWSLIV